MNFDPELAARIFAPLVSLLVGVVVKRYTEARSLLTQFVGHVSQFTINDEARTRVFTHAIVIRNTGRKSANNIRVGHTVLPPNIELFPNVSHEIKRNTDGSGEIIVECMVPKEQVTISYLYYPPLTWDRIHTYTKSDDGMAKIISVVPMTPPSRILVGAMVFLTFIGTSYVVYWLFKLAVWLVSL